MDWWVVNRAVKMLSLITSAIVIFSVLIFPVSAENILLQDDFESYNSGSFPSSGGWKAYFNAVNDPSHNIVTDSTSYSGSKSLQVYGSHSGCWAALVAHDLPKKDVIYIEASIKASGEAGGGCHKNDIQLGLGWKIMSWGHYWKPLISFRSDEKIYGIGGVLQDFTPNKWYKIKIKLDLTKGKITYWINGNEVATRSLDPFDYSYLAIESGDGKGWIDDIKVYYETTAETYTVNFYTVNGGTITFAGKTYSDGQSAKYAAGTYTAKANSPSGYGFSAWATLGGVSVSNKYSSVTEVTVSGNGNLVASFQPIVRFQTNPPNVGSITISGTGRNTGTYTHGQSAMMDQDCLDCYTVTANPPSGYVFMGWSVSGSLSLGDVTSRSTSLVVKGPGTLTANFVKQSPSPSDKIVSLPALAIHGGKDTWLLEVDRQVVEVNLGETFTINVKYQIWSTPGIIRQAYFIASWTPTWPPPSGYYFPVYDGIPGSYPGVTGTKTITVKAPSKPGEYVLWFVGHAHYSLSQAINTETGERKDKILSSSGHILVRVKQDSPPSVTIIKPSNGEKFEIADTSIKIRIRAQATDDVGVSKVEFYVDGDLISTDYDEPFEIEKVFSEGSYTITVKAYDTSNQVGTDSVMIYVERVDNPPTVKIISPADGQVFTTENSVEIEVVAEARDDHGISKIEFYVDGAYITTDYSEPYKVITELSEGMHTITAKAYDTSGQVDTDSVTVEVVIVTPTPTPFVDVRITKISGGNLVPEELRRSYIAVYVKNYGNVDTSCKIKVEVYGVNKLSKEQTLSVKSGEETNVAFYWEDLPLDKYKVKAWLYCNGELRDFKEKVIEIGYAIPSPTLTLIPTPTLTPTQTQYQGATVTFEYETSTSTLSLEIDSPSQVKDAQIKIIIPQGSTIGSSECSGFLSGCTYLRAGTEHRWFVLRESGSGGKLGWLTLKLTLPEGYSIKDVKLVGINLKDVNGVPIQVDAIFPMTPMISKQVSKLSVPAKLEYLSVSVEPKSVTAKAGDTVKYEVIIDWAPEDWSGKFNATVLVSSAGFEKRFTLSSIEVNGTPPVKQSITFTLPRDLPPLNYTVKLEISGDSVKASDVAEIKVKAPGFEVLFGVIAIILALGIRKIKLL